VVGEKWIEKLIEEYSVTLLAKIRKKKGGRG
jgi:hypothetical protein